MKIHTRYDVPKVAGYVPQGESLTQQQFKDETTIENVVAKFALTGAIDPFLINDSEPVYADVSNIPNFHEAQNLMLKAQEDFMKMPSNIRLRFDNDPFKYMDFVNNPDNIEEGINLGIFVKKEEQPEAPAEGGSI
ncbi:minor capsid protein [Capybara microvirus Cap1_SP_200]|nr:minor capsid protein [Capybara microvirus Cap1_SP_200]